MSQQPIPPSFYNEEWHKNNKFWIYGDNEAGKRKTEGDAPKLIMRTFTEPFQQLKVLDAGSGRGWLGLFLKELGANITCLDYSSWSVRHSVVPADAILGDMTEMKFKDNSFDLVISRENFEHLTVEQAEKAFSELVRVTKRWIYMTIWLNFDPNAKDDEVLTDLENDPSHITFCTRKFWEKKFQPYIDAGIIKEDKAKEAILDWRGKGRVFVFEKINS